MYECIIIPYSGLGLAYQGWQGVGDTSLLEKGARSFENTEIERAVCSLARRRKLQENQTLTKDVLSIFFPFELLLLDCVLYNLGAKLPVLPARAVWTPWQDLYMSQHLSKATRSTFQSILVEIDIWQVSNSYLWNSINGYTHSGAPKNLRQDNPLLLLNTVTPKLNMGNIL